MTNRQTKIIISLLLMAVGSASIEAANAMPVTDTSSLWADAFSIVLVIVGVGFWACGSASVFVNYFRK